MKNEKVTIERHCDYDDKIISDNFGISIDKLDFCSTECLEKYIEENNEIQCPYCKGKINYDCYYCGNKRVLKRSISDLLNYTKNEMLCKKCNGIGRLSHILYNTNEICNICNGTGMIKLPNKKV